MSLDRRSFLKALFIAPAIIKTAGLLMPVKKIVTDVDYRVIYVQAKGAVVRDLYYHVPLTPPIDYAFLEGMSQSVVQTIIYGNKDDAPILFDRFFVERRVA